MLVKLTDICDIQYGYAFDSAKFSDTDGVPLVRIRDVLRGFSETRTTEEFPGAYAVKNGDILIGMDGEFNIAKWQGGSAALNQRVCRLIPRKVSTDYIFHFMPSALKQIEEKTPFVTVKHLSAKELNKIAVPLPDKEEQDRIANTLNGVAHLISCRKQQLQTLDGLVKARFVEMFGLYPDNPMGWRTGVIRDVVSDVRYGSSRPAVEGGQYPYLRMNNITYGGELDLTDTKRIDVPENELDKCTVRRGDVLFNRTNSKELVGKTCVYNRDEMMVLAGFVIRVRLNDKMLPEFLSAFLNTDFSKQMLLGMCKAAIGQANINAQEMQGIGLYIPPIEQQRKFVSFKAQVDKVTVPEEIIAKYAPRMRYTHFDVKHGRDEAENREMYLKASMREAGWPIVTVPHQSLPGAVGCMIHLDSGEDIDYMMYGKDGKPLAIVEYTVTCSNPLEGRKKVIAQADKIAQKIGYKPIAYYTNGYYIFVIDQLGYKPRRVFQFHSIEELELLKLRVTLRQDISNPQVDANIAGRPYQQEAISASCKAFSEMRRSSLIVMATGTGKTRVSIALTDVLMKANWAKNILFLADRTSLVRQAHKNFNKLLPSVTTSIYSGTSTDRDPNARIIFSTYQTMINLIEDDTREFGIGRFDLIIIDEAHRSVFNKYGALFRYFDALLLGLTATPRNEENKSTYEVFSLPNGQPDYAFELEAAIAGKYLVGFSVLDKTTEKMRSGIVYNDLTDEEKASFEDAFATGDDEETDFSGAVIEARQVGRRVINIGTIDAMLNDLMKNGLKINGGDKIGKTIIFASSHPEAEQIVLRFQHLYKHLGPDFCKLIDSKVENSQSLIDTFTERDNLPQIAVSVDMMDTGIDVPDVLNLVFFKSVGSKIKFLQMIGRGTRLSPDVFGPGMDKQGFLIFDYFDNFRYFSTGNTWSTVEGSSDKKTYATASQSVLMNRYKLDILRQLQEMAAPSAFEKKYRDELLAFFIDSTQLLCNDGIDVQYNMAYVSKYRTPESWDGLTKERIEEIDAHILPLLPTIPAPAKVKSFDMIIYAIEAGYMERIAQGKDPRKIRHGFVGVDQELTDRMQELLKLKTIPQIVKKEKLIASMMHGDYLLDDFSLEKAESVRKELRDLMAYIPDKPSYYIINTADWIVDGDEGEGPFVKQKTYAEKAQEYIDKDSPALAKLRNLDELTADEKANLHDVFTVQLGTLADYNAWSNNTPLLPFLRVQTGINEAAIQTKFGSFLNDSVLDEAQLAFMSQIIDYARTNGDITAADLLKVSPFCDMDIMGLFGAEKFGYVKQLINGLHKTVM